MRRIGRILRRSVLYGLLGILVLMAAGSVYQWWGSRQDRQLEKPPGRIYEVQGHRMHLYSGGAGKATVVLLPGWGTVNPYVDFYPLYEKLAPHTAFAVVDRLGYGYSDVTDRERDIDNIVGELRELLTVSGTKPPYVLAAHSLGALEAVRYAQRYPEEVAGLVMLDGGSPEYYNRSMPLTAVSYVQRFLVRTGVARVLYHSDGFVRSLNDERNGLERVPDSLKEMDRRSTLLKANNKSITDEIRRSKDNAVKILEGPRPLTAPMTVLTAKGSGERDLIWEESQALFPSWSVSGKQITVENAEHYLYHYEPELVAREILAYAGLDG